MRRLQLLLAALALSVVACSDSPDTTGTSQLTGSGGDPETSTTAGADVTAASETTETTETTEGNTETTSDRPPAPDFTLALGDGGSYTLSEGEKPVYLVFWAEW